MQLQLGTQYLPSDGIIYVMNQMVLVGIDPEVSHLGGERVSHYTMDIRSGEQENKSGHNFAFNTAD